MWRRWFQRSRKPFSTPTRQGSRTRLGWEVLEDRTVPSAPTIAITDGVGPAPAGSLDLAFGGGDGIASGLTQGPLSSIIDAVQVLPDGRILGGGVVGLDFGLFVVDAEGAPDPSFGSNGVATADFDGLFDAINAIALAPGGKIVAAGGAGDNRFDDFAALARFHGDGTLDTSFDSDGRVVLDLGEGADVF
jgi:uncharacterized delta-60 repeat protein